MVSIYCERIIYKVGILFSYVNFDGTNICSITSLCSEYLTTHWITHVIKSFVV